ncbi:polyprenyl synthetase family protein [Desulfitibacter alkalitolerans]|uniref:polyprenyl synthetase family protein n=1 Tax=Desulfitibacter alkalitolerans TaxID=264641 RepID=UPI0004837395|nr:polyprenyl synthetase family protein [Desulfitibacter alkalitolerans]
MATIINFLDNQLTLSDQMLLKDFNIRNKCIWDLTQFNIDNKKRHFYPKLFLLSYSLFKRDTNVKVISMAAIIQLIYLASEIHKYEGDKPEYPVLVGDYLFSMFFQNLCKYDMIEWLGPLSQTISTMQLGSMERFENNSIKSSNLSTISKESASLGEISCALGANFAKAPDRAVNSLKEIGFILGLIFGLLEDKKPAVSKVLNYIEEVEEQIPIINSLSKNKEKVINFQQMVNNFKASILEVNSKVC